MKGIITWLLYGAFLGMLYGVAFWQGARRERAASVRACERAMAPVCTAVSLVNLKQVERIIAARNRQPIVVECRR